MGKRIDMITSSLGKSFNFTEKNLKQLSIQFLKIYLLTALVYTVGLGLIVLIVLAITGIGQEYDHYVTKIIENIGLILTTTILIFIIMGGIAFAISITMYNTIEKIEKSENLSIIENVGNLFAPSMIYNFLLVIIFIIMMLPLLIAFIGNDTTSLSSFFVKLGFVLLIQMLFFILYIIFAITIQFAPLEIAINKNSPIDAIKKSIAMVSKNKGATVLYMIALWIVSAVVGTIFQIIIQIISIVSFPLFAVGIAGVLIFAILMIALIIVYMLGISVAVVPFQYFFWKKISDEKNQVY